MKTLIRFSGLVLLALLASAPVHAQLIVQPTVSFLSGTFQYRYNISNQTSTDISVVTLSGIFSAPNAVMNLTAPSGFLAFFDPGVSLLSFLEDTQTFGAGLISGPFTFDSPYAPTLGGYEAIDVTGSLLVGSTQVPGGLATSAVPEPATTAAFGALALLGLVFHRKFFTKKYSQS